MAGGRRDVLRQVHRLFDAGSLAGLADGELLNRFAARRDEAAFEALVARHGPMVLRVCRSVVGNRGHDADDAFQATFVVLARRAGSLWVGDSLGSWLFGVARRAATRARRAAVRRARHERGAAEAGRLEAVHEGIDHERAEVAAAVVDEVQRLPGAYRSAVVLCYFEGLTYEEAACRLGVSEGTVRGRLSRARDRLRPRLIHRGVGVPALLAVAAVSARSASAVPASLSRAVKAAAIEVISGNSTTAVAVGAVPASAAVLAECVLKEIAMGVLKKAAGALLLVTCTLAAARGFQVDPAARLPGTEPASPRVANEPEFLPPSAGPGRDLDEPPLITRQVPRPWETVVRIRTQAPGVTGFGSGTVISSTSAESLILTCGRLLKDDVRDSPTARSSQRITVDLFDGKLMDSGRAQVRPALTTIAEVVDYDVNHVGLLRIRPGRKLPASPIVPSSWRPTIDMEMVTAGCSEGHDATFWTTQILQSGPVRLSTDDAHTFIECRYAPKQGRSGGGLFTTDGLLAGVCMLAEPNGNRGFYAAPASIYAILDRNGLSSLYTGKPSSRAVLPAAEPPVAEQPPPGTVGLAFSNPVPAVTPSLADHERRLREVEQKLERLIRQRQSAVESRPRTE